MIELAISLLAVAAFWAFAEWRLGLVLSLATAVLQDPLRKLVPEQPIFLVVFVAVVFGSACLGAWSGGMPLTPRGLLGRDRQLMVPLSLFLLLIILQAFNSYLRFDNLMIPLNGLLTYLLPFFSIAFAYYIVFREGEVRLHQFIKYYVVFIILALTTVYLEYAGYNWSVLGQVGSRFVIFDKLTGQIIVPYAGIFRASEIAAWHAVTCACFVLLLVTWRKVNIKTLGSATIMIALLMGIAVLTGRRKAIIELAVFAGTYLILWAVLQKGARKIGIASIITVVVGFFWLVGQLGGDLPVSLDDPPSGYFLYVERSKSVFQDAPTRFVEFGIGPIMWAYDSFGVFGAGLGIGTQGAQHFGGGGSIAGAAEGGLGKITLELGIPGLFVLGWLGILVFSHLWSITRTASRISPRIARLSYGLFSFLVANVAAFSVSTQAYGDPFILLILSWAIGFLLAVPVLLEREMRARQPAMFEELTPVFRPKTV